MAKVRNFTILAAFAAELKDNCLRLLFSGCFRLYLRMDFIIRQLESVGSTNAYLQQLFLKEKVAEGFVVLAREQQSGKGHGANSWESEAGKNLTFSLLLRPDAILPEQQFLLTQLISLALVDLVKDFLPGESVSIKWPNDIYIGEQKAAGILIQNFIKGQNIDASIVGIGLNVNQQSFSSGAPNPVSLVHFTHKPLDITDVLDKLLLNIQSIYRQSQSISAREALHQRYLSHLFRYGKPVFFKENGLPFKATITGIGKFGQLILQLENGAQKQFAFKEVEFVI